MKLQIGAQLILLALPMMVASEEVICHQESYIDTQYTSPDDWYARIRRSLRRNVFTFQDQTMWYSMTFVPHSTLQSATQRQNARETNRALFEHRVRLLNHFSDKLGYPLLDFCYITPNFGAILRKRYSKEVYLTHADLLTLKGLERARLYAGMSEIFFIAYKIDRFYGHLRLLDIALVGGDVTKPRLIGLSTLQNFDNIKEYHNSLVEKKMVPPTVNFYTFYPKYFFREFVMQTETYFRKHSTVPDDVRMLPRTMNILINKMMGLDIDMEAVSKLMHQAVTA